MISQRIQGLVRAMGMRAGVALALAAALPVEAQVDWKAQQAEVLRHYRALVQIDSSNPPGNETKVVDYLKKVLEGEGIPTKTFASDPTRANIVARLKGTGKRRPILILAHSDVVGVQREKWPVDPFGAVLKDGYVWGRGTTDDKDKLVANLMTMLLLKRSGAVLDRDVIFLAEAGEEGNGDGINFMVAEHFNEIDAEFALSEGGYNSLVNGKVAAVRVSTGEKVPRRATLVASGTSGHGSMPRLDNPLVHLSQAIAKVAAWEPPMRLNDTTRAYFERLASISSPEAKARYNGLTDPSKTAQIQRYFAANEIDHYSMLRTSISPTVLNGGFRENVIPSEAQATLDIRALPGENINAFYDQVRSVIGDPAVKLVPVPSTRPDAPASKLDTEMFRVLERIAKRMYPEATTLPYMMTGASDLAQLRAKGVQAYGIGPSVTAEDFAQHWWHSDVEHLAEASIYQFAEFTYDAVWEIARVQ